jgi:transposase-like protein
MALVTAGCEILSWAAERASVRWYVAYPLSLRNLEEMIAEHSLEVDHATVHR